LEIYLLGEDAPYVVKDAWLFAYCDEIDTTEVAIDALIIPVRELMSAATSRIFQERMDLADSEWRRRPLVNVKGGAEGGVVYSLDPTDQARILAVGFYQLIHWAVANDIPLVFLEFPRLVEDDAYLIDSLWPWLEPHCTLAQAKEAFASTARTSAVRIDEKPEVLHAPSESSNFRDPASAARLDRDAMAALLDERVTSTHSQLAAIEHKLLCAEQDLADTHGRLSEAEQALHDAQTRLAENERRTNEKNRTLEDVNNRLATVQTSYEEMTQTISWRVTRPLRALRRAGGRKPHG
jgi:hypothetical protein